MNQRHGDDTFINHPANVGRSFTDWYIYNQTHPGLTWGVPEIDEKVIPLKPGEVAGIMGRPGNGKTALLNYLIGREVERILQREQEGEDIDPFGEDPYREDRPKEIVAAATWETAAEEMLAFQLAGGEWSASDIAWGRVPPSEIKRRVVEQATNPLWIIGHSFAHATERRPQMTLNRVLDTVRNMERQYNVRPTLLVFDYLQIIPVEGVRDRVAQILESAPMIKEVALELGVPAYCAIQAAREVDNRSWKVPQMRDAAWGSAIEKAFDKLFGIWRPAMTEAPDAEPIEFTTSTGRMVSVPISHSALIMQMTKQRGDVGRATWALDFRPQDRMLAAMRDPAMQ